MSKPTPPEKFDQFLAVLREVPNVSEACRRVGVSDTVFRVRRRVSPEFAAEWDEAIEQGLDNAEAIAHQRAFYGANKPLTHQGQIIHKRDYSARVVDPETGLERYVEPHLAPLLRDTHGNLIPETVPEVSDTLVMFLLKAYRPEKFRERSDVNVTGQIDIANAILAARKRSGNA